MLKRVHLVAAGLFAVSPSLALSEVKVCDLRQLPNELDPTLTIYSHESFAHSILLEFTTDYGDRLPNLFGPVGEVAFGLEEWKATPFGDDYEYTLYIQFEDDLPKLVKYVTKSLSDDFSSEVSFEVLSCNSTTVR